MEDYLSIKEFSELARIDATTLRYWDEIGLFPPAKRVKNNKYRYYTSEQAIAANFITVLKGLNIPLKTINEIESKRTPQTIVELIENHERLLDKELRRLQEAYSIIHMRLGFMKDGLKADPDSISVVKFEERNIIVGEHTDFGNEETFYRSFKNFCDSAVDLRINLAYPIGGLHESMEAFLDSPSKPEHYFSVDPTGNIAVKAGDYLVGYSRGYYGEFGDLPQRMAAYADEHHLKFVGSVYATYLLDEVSTGDPSEYLTRVRVGVTKK